MNLFRWTVILILVISAQNAFPQGDWDAANRKALQQYQAGAHEEAIQTADEALSIARSRFGEVSEQYSTSLSNKAYAQFASGDFLKALANFREAVQLNTQIYSLPHVAQMESYIELAKSFMELGTYDSADHYLNLARSVFIRVPDANKAHYDSSFFRLADAYIKLNGTDASVAFRKGQTARAVALLESQLSLLRELYPQQYQTNADYIATVNNLTTYYVDLKDPERARLYAREFNSMVKDRDSESDRIQALLNLGNVFRILEENDSAIFHWRHALTLLESGPYRNSRLHIAVLGNMGELYAQLEVYDSAIWFLNASVIIQQAREAIQPRIYQTTLSNLAEAYRWSGDYVHADSLYSILIKALIDEVVYNFTYLSDDEKLSFYKNQRYFINNYLFFALEVSGAAPLQQADRPYINKKVTADMYNVQLATKAVILNSSKRMRAGIMSSGNPQLVQAYTEWEEAKNRLAGMLLSGRYSSMEVAMLRASIEEKEKWLASNSRNFARGFQVERITWEQVRDALKPGEAAVEFIRMVDGLIYGALVVTPETSRPVLSLVLSTQSRHLENQFFQNYHNAIMFELPDTLSYSTYWQPVIDSIRAYMPGNKIPDRVFVSNDGVYNRINLNTLKNPATNRYVIDETDIVVLTNTRDIVAAKMSKNLHSNAALFGRPAYSSGNTSRNLFTDLEGTGEEVRLIAQNLKEKKWKVDLYTGAEASEENLKVLKTPGILHLASHGYFTPGTGDDSSLAETMIRSGIALAGANDTTFAGEDGLLTAYEVTGLDLDSTQLVVLSACETARGIDNHGEGVYGLQRALRVAGAENIIMSLWKVDDTATQELMVTFYRLFAETNDLRNSFRLAQQHLREKHPEPFYWGAFILGR